MAMALALSQRPASRFFAVFYRWTLHTHCSRPHTVVCQLHRDGARMPANSYLRRYHATRQLRRRNPSDEQSMIEKLERLSKGSSYVQGVGRKKDSEGNALAREILGEARARESVDGAHQKVSTQSKAKFARSYTKKQDTIVEPNEVEHGEVALKKTVRTLLRKVPNSVAVITVHNFDPHLKTYVPMGVAVSSLTSVTLDPPTISFNIKKPSKTLDAIRAAKGRFRVHFLSADRGGSNIVESFCQGNHPDAYNQRSKDLRIHIPSITQDEVAAESLAPQIWHRSVHAAMECTITHELPVADHVILAARVESLELKQIEEPLMIYVDGRYMQAQNTVGTHGQKKQSPPIEDSFSIWDYSFFPGPGEEARQAYLKYIETVIVKRSLYPNNSLKDGLLQLERSLPYSASNLGINLMPILFALGQRHDPENHIYRRMTKSGPSMFSFYGRLTPRNKARVVDEAIKLVREDPTSLSLDYTTFLHRLSVSTGSRDFLPSDIMSVLRAEGLVGDFEPRKRNEKSSRDDIQALEQVEHQVRDHLRTLDFTNANTIPLEAMIESMGEPAYPATLLKRARSRLVAEAHPDRFDESKIDIAGEVTKEEARVVLNRILRYLRFRTQERFTEQFSHNPYWVLRHVHVHPTITGMDIEYLYGKINHLYKSAASFRGFTKAMDEMQEPWFHNDVSLEELVDRVKQLVEMAPLRALEWRLPDLLAAMGLRWAATVTLRSQEGKVVREPLNDGITLSKLIDEELKSRYLEGGKEEDTAIVEAVKKKYLDSPYTLSNT